MNHLTDETLNEYLDHEVTDRSTVERHLAECADCTARLATMQTLFTELESLPEMNLSRDLAAPVMRRVAGSAFLPRWLTLTVALQAVLALIVLAIAAPFVIELVSESASTLQLPSLVETFTQLQAQWVSWLAMLSQFEMPAMPQMPIAEVSSLYLMLTAAGIFMFWLVGNGLLLRNQIK
jgi:anti-sigma factor RsiW